MPMVAAALEEEWSPVLLVYYISYFITKYWKRKPQSHELIDAV